MANMCVLLLLYGNNAVWTMQSPSLNYSRDGWMILLEILLNRCCMKCCQQDIKALNHKDARFVVFILGYIRGQVFMRL